MSGNVVTLPTSGHLQPTEHLTDAEAAVWRSTVEARASDFFGEDVVPLLEEYCRVVVMCRVLSGQVQAVLAGDEEGNLRALMEMRDRESRRMAGLATKLRITNQSRYTPQAAATAAKRGGKSKVWQFGK